jgi:hypothetical protein
LVPHTKYYSGYKIKETDLSAVCGTHVGDEKCTHGFWWGKPAGARLLRETSPIWEIILKWVL